MAQLPNNNSKPFGAALVLEDDEHMRALLANLLRQIGFERVVETTSVADALDRLSLDAFAVVLVDLGLGNEDGLTFIRSARDHACERARAAPIVVVSKTTTEARILEAIQAGADGFIAKPLTMASFYRQVSLAIVKRGCPAPVATPTSSGEVLAAVRGSKPRADVFEID